MSPAQEPTELERRYRRLLRWYPPSHRAAHREEMLGVLLATARPGQRRPGARQTVNLVACGLAIRAGRFLNAGRWQDALAVVSLIGPVLALAVAALNVAVAVRQEVALDDGWRPAAPFWRADLVPDLGGPAIVMFCYLAVVLLALAGQRRAAAAAASVPLALSLAELLILVPPQTGIWSIRLPVFLWTANGGPVFPVFLASLAASSLAFSAGPRRGLAVAGRRRACLMIAGLIIVFGSSPAVPLLKPHAQLSGPVSRLVYVLGIVLAIAVSRVGSTVGRRVAALVTAGLLPGLVTVALPIASGQADLLVFLLGSLLVTVLVWPLAIVSWQRQVRRA